MEVVSMGNVIDNLKFGQYAICVADDDLRTIFSIDESGWYYVIPPHRKYKRRTLSFQKSVEGILNRWEIKEIDELFKSIVEEIDFID